MIVRFEGNGVVWDPERLCTLCEFKNGTCTTDEDRVITIMRKNGYEETVIDMGTPRVKETAITPVPEVEVFGDVPIVSTEAPKKTRKGATR
jgi:hypothetical protein